jgi:hypothetical protein
MRATPTRSTSPLPKCSRTTCKWRPAAHTTSRSPGTTSSKTPTRSSACWRRRDADGGPDHHRRAQAQHAREGVGQAPRPAPLAGRRALPGLSQQSYLLGDAATDANWCSIDDYAQTTLSAAAAPALPRSRSPRPPDLPRRQHRHRARRRGDPVDHRDDERHHGDARRGHDRGRCFWQRRLRLHEPHRAPAERREGHDLPARHQQQRHAGAAHRQDEYDLLTAKTQTGKTIQVAYQPFLDLRPAVDVADGGPRTDVLRFTIERPVQDFDSTTRQPRLPDRGEHGALPQPRRAARRANGARDELATLYPRAQQALEDWLDGDVENASVKFQPDLRRAAR